MRKRQLKKFAKDAKNNMRVYRPAPSKGSKKLRRRWKTMCRYWDSGGANAEKHRIMTMKLKDLEQRIKVWPRGDAVSRLAKRAEPGVGPEIQMGPEEACAALGALITEWTLSIPTPQEELGASAAPATKS